MPQVILLKRCLLFFWALWLSVVFLSNLADAARELGLLDRTWAFASGNFKFIQETTARYAVPDWLNATLFAGVILWEAIACLLFWRAGSIYHERSSRKALYSAFTMSLLLWAGFLLADEIFIAYPQEAVHLRLFVAHLVTLLAIELLPEQPGRRASGD